MIYYYSACGNSRHVAQSLADAMNEQLLFIPDAARDGQYSLKIADGETLGFVFPIYSWRAPQLVTDFLNMLRIEGQPSYVYFVSTYGDNAGLAEKLFRKQLAAKGLALDAAYGIAMPNTYVNISFMNLDSPELTQQKLSNAESEIAAVTEMIKTKKRISTVCRGNMPWFKSIVIGGSFNRRLSDKDFFAADQCIACGKCIEVCPLHNIALENSRPVWHGNCNHCEACYHYCPTHAILYGKATRGKGQYHFGKLQ